MSKMRFLIKYGGPEHLSEYFKDPSMKTHSDLSMAVDNLSLTPDHIDHIVKNHSFDFVHRALNHPNATAQNMITASKDEDKDVRKIAASSPKTPVHVLDHMMENDVGPVKVYVLKNPNATLEHISAGLSSSSPSIRKAAASHPSATRDHLVLASTDQDEHVRSAAKDNPKYHEYFNER